ncbi:MAG: hypothetical protein LBP32_03670 [Spirochaetaceae bacterium]|jgi:undecaprenyl pyrophosphate phosphatase UppP|nr:hypothetical protein [Spirochaetaceae bacterium]
MKITRTWLLRIIGGMGLFIIVYSVIRHVTGVGFGEAAEKYLFDTIVFVALALFLYNRKLAADERKEREQKEKEQKETETMETDEEPGGSP